MNLWTEYNFNPIKNRTDDCAVRAVAAALDIDWDEAFDMIAANAKQMGEMMHKNVAWWSVLRQHGFQRAVIPNTCPDCFSVRDFAMEHPRGVYILGFDDHVATMIDGRLIDSWNSTRLIPIYYWYRRG